MSIAFFVSSAGDTSLAKSTIENLLKKAPDTHIILIPLTKTAESITEPFAATLNNDSSNTRKIIHNPLNEIVEVEKLTVEKKLNASQLEKINNFIKQKEVKQAYIGVPSPIDEHTPFNIVEALDIPYVMAYEFMFENSSNHPFWSFIQASSAKENCTVAVPLLTAEKIIKEKNSQARTHIVGHLSLDQALGQTTVIEKNKIQATKDKLSIKPEEELVLISGSTQPKEIDLDFLACLLQELETEKYLKIQLRFSIHPGVANTGEANFATYLNSILNLCNNHPKASDKIKIILSNQLAQKLTEEAKQIILSSPYIQSCDVSGAEAADAADRIGQAVPGKLVNDAALAGKPAFYKASNGKSYLDENLFANNVAAFFTKPPQAPASIDQLGLKNTVGENMAELITSLKFR